MVVLGPWFGSWVRWLGRFRGPLVCDVEDQTDNVVRYPFPMLDQHDRRTLDWQCV